MNISVSVFNTLLVADAVPPSDTWVLQAFPIAVWPTCISHLPVGFVVVKGNSSVGALGTMAANSTLEGGLSVACNEETQISQITFQPHSDQTNVTGVDYTVGVSTVTLGYYHLASSFTVSGYWDYPLTAAEGSALFTPDRGGQGTWFAYPEVSPTAGHAFVPGTYTVVVEDEWGQIELLHFAVVPASGP